ncbi:MAG: MetQ/NlpA family ABC transporter substrate-binding protein [Shinella sp.]|uniref:MetQ/NlpA family ABC transporter substrate-binding protein n=1 Tax=Shinella sp. TaxID=1870904 RepID=UPI00403720A6
MRILKSLTIVASLALAAFGTAKADETLVVGATAIPHAEILEFVKPILAKEGLDLDIRVFTDYIQPNAQLVSGELDANYYQYRPFLNDYNKQRGTELVPIVPVHIEPFVAYSTKIDAVDKLEDGATVAIPNDPVNGGRGLLLPGADFTGRPAADHQGCHREPEEPEDRRIGIRAASARTG